MKHDKSKPKAQSKGTIQRHHPKAWHIFVPFKLTLMTLILIFMTTTGQRAGWVPGSTVFHGWPLVPHPSTDWTQFVITLLCLPASHQQNQASNDEVSAQPYFEGEV